jgi:hypothetical protein
MALSVLYNQVPNLPDTGTSFSTFAHVIPSGTTCLLCALMGRAATTAGKPAGFQVRWGGSSGPTLTQAKNSWNTSTIIGGIQVWVGYLRNPEIDRQELVITTIDGIAVGGLGLLLVDLSGEKASGSIIGAFSPQVQANPETNRVGLGMSVSGSGNMAVAMLAVGGGSSMTNFTGAGFNSWFTGQQTNSNAMMATYRRRMNALGAVNAEATFNVSSQAIGGALFEVLAEPETSADLDVTETIGLDMSASIGVQNVGAQSSSFNMPARRSFSYAQLVDSDRSGVDRSLIRYGDFIHKRFSIEQVRLGTSGANIWRAHMELDDGPKTVESRSAVQTLAPQHVAFVKSDGGDDRLYLDGKRSVNLTQGTARGALQTIADAEFAVGGHTANDPAGFDGLAGRLLLYDGEWDDSQVNLMAASQLNTASMISFGDEDLPEDGARSPLALPARLDLKGRLDVVFPLPILSPPGTPATITSWTTPSRVTVSVASGGIRIVAPAGWSGVDSFSYTVEAGGKSSVGLVQVVQTGSTIVAQPDKIVVAESAGTTFNVLDTVYGSGLTISSVSDPPKGVAFWTVGGTTVTYQAHQGETGADSFVVTLVDTLGIKLDVPVDVTIGTTDVTPSSPPHFVAIGDLVYPSGTLTDFNATYHTRFGRWKNRTIPCPGNHEYNTSGAAGYFAYFAGLDPYYRRQLDANWVIYSLNTNIAFGSGSAQANWLASQLAAETCPGRIFFGHHAHMTSSSAHAPDPQNQFMTLAQTHTISIWLWAHNHHYERFVPQNGVSCFTVGTGGHNELYAFGSPVSQSALRNNTNYGVLQLDLRPTDWTYRFRALSGAFTDTGTRAINGLTGTPPSTPTFRLFCAGDIDNETSSVINMTSFVQGLMNAPIL